MTPSRSWNVVVASPGHDVFEISLHTFQGLPDSPPREEYGELLPCPEYQGDLFTTPLASIIPIAIRQMVCIRKPGLAGVMFVSDNLPWIRFVASGPSIHVLSLSWFVNLLIRRKTGKENYFILCKPTL